MAITIDATPAGVDANSYNTLVEANAYFEAFQEFNTLWAALTTVQQNAWLVASTYAIDRYDFVSRKYRDFSFEQNEQALEFPRLSDIRIDLIHPRVKKAQLEMLKYLYNNTDGTTGESTFLDDDRLSQVTVVGVVSVSFSNYVSIDAKNAVMAVGSGLEAVEALLRPWLEAGLRDSGPFDWVK